MEKAVTAATRKGAYMEPDSTTGHRSRGRVVMLVDNGVKGDSRVQKAARSAADAGWDVVLFGSRPTVRSIPGISAGPRCG
ncbi:hypothetical protein NKH18_16640 [Streptomyces sp. M10(2022)]